MTVSPVLSITLILAATGCQTQPQISYRTDVQPILEDNCMHCHTPPGGKGYKKTGLSMADYKSLMAGTVYGPVIVPGDSRKSILNMLIEGRADTSMRMPHDADKPLTDQEIRILHLWVEQGARNN